MHCLPLQKFQQIIFTKIMLLDSVFGVTVNDAISSSIIFAQAGRVLSRSIQVSSLYCIDLQKCIDLSICINKMIVMSSDKRGRTGLPREIISY